MHEADVPVIVIHRPSATTAPTSRRDPFTVLDAPCNLGLRAPGAGRRAGRAAAAPTRCAACGLVEAAGRARRRAGRGARRTCRCPVNRAALAGYTRALADRVGALLDAGARPLVLGGDCSILLGAMLALRRRGRYGLAARRRAPGLPPPGLVGRDRRRRGRGPRGRDRAPGAGAVRHRRPRTVRRSTPTPCTSAIARATRASWRRSPRRHHRARRSTSCAAPGRSCPSVPYWVHVDADVLDSALLPAVDSPAPAG